MILLCFPATRRVDISPLKLDFSTSVVCKQSTGSLLNKLLGVLNLEDVISNLENIINSNTCGNQV